MIIYVMRHGLSEFNKKGIVNGQLDDDLSPEGKEQTRKDISLVPKSIRHIYSSPLRRAKETAEILNDKLHLPLTFHDELKEVSFGVLEGAPFSEENKKKYKTLEYDWRPSGESVEDVKTRVLKIVAYIGSNSGNGEALTITHGGIIRMLHFLEDKTCLDGLGHSSIFEFDLSKILKSA